MNLRAKQPSPLRKSKTNPYSDTAFYIICSLIVFAPLARGSVHPWAATVIQVGILLAAVSLIVEKMVMNQTDFPATPMNKPIVAIAVLCLFSFAFSHHKPMAFEGLFMFFIYIAAFFAAQLSIRTRKQQRILIYVIISTAILISAIGIFKRFGLNPFPWWIYPEDHTSTSVSGVYVNRNHMAGFLEMAIPMVLVLFLTRQRDTAAKLGLIFLVLFLLITQAFTLSRGGWISTISAILFMAIILSARKNFVQKKIIFIIGSSVLIISLFVLASLPVVERITTLTQQDQADNLSGRIRAWKGTILQIKENPYLGTGPNTFTQAYPAYQIPGDAVLRRYSHNDYLQFTAETGILFIPVLLFTLFSFFKTGFRKLKSSSRQTRSFTLGAMTGVVAILIHSFSDFNLNIPANAFVFTIIAALATQQTLKGT